MGLSTRLARNGLRPSACLVVLDKTEGHSSLPLGSYRQPSLRSGLRLQAQGCSLESPRALQGSQQWRVRPAWRSSQGERGLTGSATFSLVKSRVETLANALKKAHYCRAASQRARLPSCALIAVLDNGMTPCLPGRSSTIIAGAARRKRLFLESN